MTNPTSRASSEPLSPDLLRLAAGVPAGPLPGGSDEALLRLTASPLSAFGRLVAPLVAGLRATGDLDRLLPATRRILLARRDDAVRADLVARRFVTRRLVPAWPAGMPLALVKGAALNGAAYGDHEPRRARDLDLVVAAPDRERALRALQALGGVLVVQPGRRVSHGRSSERTLRFEGALPVEVDLHAGFVEPGLAAVDQPRVWERSVPWPLASRTEVRVLDPGDALAHLALHALTHARLGARSLVDAHRLVTHRPPDWTALPAIAAAWGASTPLYLLLTACRDLLGTPVVPSALAALAPAPWKRRLGSSLLGAGRVDDPAGLPVGVRRVLALALLDRPAAAFALVPRQAWRRLLDVADRLAGAR